MENVSDYRKIAKVLNEGKIVTKKTKITEDRFLEERLSGRFTLVICGGGHISKSLSSMAKLLGYQIWIVDDREEFANQERFPQADRVFCMDFQEAFEKLDVPESAWYVIVTRGHQNDYECLRNVLTRKSSYVGMIGSRKKVDMTFQRLREEGFTEEQIDCVHAPIGLPIGAKTPEEITVSILAEMVQERAKLGCTELPKEMLEWLLQKEETMVMASVVEKKGSAPRGIGARMLVAANGMTTGTIGGGVVEHLAAKRACSMIKEETQCESVTYELGADKAAGVGMICGGSVEILFEKVL